MKRFAVALTLPFLTASLYAAPPITAVAFTPDGRSLVVGSQSGLEVRTWPALKLDRLLNTQMPNIHDLAFSSDGKTLAVTGGIPGKRGMVELFTWPDGKLRAHANSHRDSIYKVAWRSDSAMLLTASADRTIGILHANSAKTSQLLEGHSRGVLAVAYLPGDAEIISAGIDESVRLWDAKTGDAIRTLANHTRPVHDVAVRPGTTGNSPPTVVSVSDDRTVRLWQPTIGRLVRFARLDSIPLAVAWAHAGDKIIVGCKDGRIRTIDPDTMEVLATLPGIDGVAYCLAVAPDGSVVVGGQNGQIKRALVK